MRGRGVRRHWSRRGNLSRGDGFGHGGGPPSQVPAADRPGADALADQHSLGHGDLLAWGGQIGSGSVGDAAVAGPGVLQELQAAVVAVAGVDVPVTAGLALGDAAPVVFGSLCRDGQDAEADGRGSGCYRPAGQEAAGADIVTST